MEPALREVIHSGRLRTIEGIQAAAGLVEWPQPGVDAFHTESLAAAENFRGIAATSSVQLWFENMNKPTDFLAIGKQ